MWRVDCQVQRTSRPTTAGGAAARCDDRSAKVPRGGHGSSSSSSAAAAAAAAAAAGLGTQPPLPPAPLSLEAVLLSVAPVEVRLTDWCVGRGRRHHIAASTEQGHCTRSAARIRRAGNGAERAPPGTERPCLRVHILASTGRTSEGHGSQGHGSGGNDARAQASWHASRHQQGQRALSSACAVVLAPSDASLSGLDRALLLPRCAIPSEGALHGRAKQPH